MYASTLEALEAAPGQIMRLVYEPVGRGKRGAQVHVRYNGVYHQEAGVGDSTLEALSAAVDALRTRLGVSDEP